MTDAHDLDDDILWAVKGDDIAPPEPLPSVRELCKLARTHVDLTRLRDLQRQAEHAGRDLNDFYRDLKGDSEWTGDDFEMLMLHFAEKNRAARAKNRQEAKIKREEPDGSIRSGPIDEDEIEAHDKTLPISDFIAFSPDHTYIHRTTGEVWTAVAVNARVMPVERSSGKKLAASKWLDRNDAVEQKVWVPGEPQIIENRMVAEGGFFAKKNARIFNLYKPPEIGVVATSREIKFWRDHLHALWPDEADHIERWFAHRAQRPGDKINHALLLGGAPGVGKDAVIQPLKRAVGAWNFSEISPQAVLGNFNEFVRSVALRISEGKDLGAIDRFALYEATKTLMAAPPDTLRCNPKYVKPYYVMNVVGVLVTTNHKVSGLYLPADDRRHFVAWSTVEPSAFSADYWIKYWATVDSGGADAVAAHLRGLDLRGFNAKAPPPRTQAFWEMVDAMRSEDESEMADVIESLKNDREPPRLDTLTVSDLIRRARVKGLDAFVAFLKDGKNARTAKIRLEQCGYRRLSNKNEERGRWLIDGERTSVYVRRDMSDREGFAAVRSRIGDQS